jgi:hypothetical protein
MCVRLGRLLEDHEHLLHSCDNPPCCNPDHLTVGTNAENVADRQAKGRTARGEAVGSATLTKDQVLEARALKASGWTYAALAERYHCGKTTIRYALQGKSWRHLGD